MLKQISGVWRKITGVEQDDKLRDLMRSSIPTLSTDSTDTDKKVNVLLTRRIYCLEQKLNESVQLLNEVVEAHNALVADVERLRDISDAQKNEFDSIAPTVYVDD